MPRPAGWFWKLWLKDFGLALASFVYNFHWCFSTSSGYTQAACLAKHTPSCHSEIVRIFKLLNLWRSVWLLNECSYCFKKRLLASIFTRSITACLIESGLTTRVSNFSSLVLRFHDAWYRIFGIVCVHDHQCSKHAQILIARILPDICTRY